MSDEVGIDKATAEWLGFETLGREAVAARLADIGGLPRPTRRETQEFLVEVLLQALRQIPASGAAWSWGEFYNGGVQPLYDMSRTKDRPRLAVCAADLGLAERQPRVRNGETLTPLDGLARNLMQATEHLLLEVSELLKRAGVSPYGPRRTDPSPS
ncbi:MAG TPA: hypothetical protein VJT68_01080 [Thermoleophilaceae bacterium]|nr:hypothetical protein [Thermoleophilaceae bacterium]